jgi:hypothetical protein
MNGAPKYTPSTLDKAVNEFIDRMLMVGAVVAVAIVVVGWL